jgi:hypothetical protein
VFLLATMLFTVAACSGDSEVDGVATLDSTLPSSETTVTSSDSVTDNEQAALAFAQCMRENGVDMGDPTVDADGNLQLPPIEFSASPDVDPEAAMAEMDATFADCEQHLEGVVLGGANPTSDVEFEDALLEYAGCMRDQGIDMPDPDLSSGMIQLGGDTPGDMEEFEAAHEECRKILARVGMDF